MEQDVKRHARRKRFSLPLALLAAGVVLSFFGMAATSRRPEAAAPPLPEFTISTDAANCIIKCERKRKPPDALFFYPETQKSPDAAIL